MNITVYDEGITDDLMELLLTADPEKSAVLSYVSDSVILTCEVDDKKIGVVVVAINGKHAELKNIAVSLQYQGKGFAKQLIDEACNLAKQHGVKTVVVGTGNSSLSQLALYQKCGFRMVKVEPNYFLSYSEPIIENGIRCIDRVILQKQL